MVEINLSGVLQPAHHSAHINIVHLEQFGRRFEASCRVVVAGSGHDLQSLNSTRCLNEEIEELLFGARRWIGGVEDVARNDARAGTLLPNYFQKPAKKMGVLVSAVVSMKCVAEMPVGGMYEFHNVANLDETQNYAFFRDVERIVF